MKMEIKMEEEKKDLIEEDVQDEWTDFEVTVDVSETEVEEEWDDFEDEEPQPVMTAIAIFGVIIALVIVGCIVLLIFKSGKDDEKTLIESTVEQIISTEELTTVETIENESTAIEQETVSAENETMEEDGKAGTNSIDENVNEETVIDAKDSVTEQESESGESKEEVLVESSSDTEEISQSQSADVQEEPVSGNESMEFTEVSDTVTAKDVTNLRTVPSTLEEGNVAAQLLNGEVLTRTGVNETYGWSRLDYNGQVVYAVSSYLTTDLSYKTPIIPGDPNRVATQDGRVIIFVDHDDYITPKEYVNLRTEPSTSEGEATVRCQIQSGDNVHRTGYSPDSGWSRVEYNGEILYVVSSMVNAAQ